jgi:hypothetical protein
MHLPKHQKSPCRKGARFAPDGWGLLSRQRGSHAPSCHRVSCSCWPELGLTAAASAADVNRPAPAPVYTKASPAVISPWDIAFGAAIMNDYNARGISNSNHQLMLSEYQELRYKWNSSLQTYLGLSGETISSPNRAAAEVDFYGGIRPTFGPVGFDFGVWYYHFPGGRCQGAGAPFAPAGCVDTLANGDTAVADASYIEYYAKA